MTASVDVVVVVVGLAGVQDDGVVEELDVAGLEVHVDVEDGVVGNRARRVAPLRDILGG